MSYHREAAYKANMISIAKAEPEKLEEYKAIFGNCSLYDHYFKKDPEFLDKTLKDLMGKAVIATDRNGEAVGWASMSVSCDYTEGLPCLTLLAVKDKFRGRGIGQLLINFYVELMANLGYSECALVVADWNPRARKLYDSLGFKTRCSFEDKIVGGFINYVLVKKL